MDLVTLALANKYTDEHSGGGTSDYTDLENKPQVNGVTLSGDKTSADLKIQVGYPIVTITGQTIDFRPNTLVIDTSVITTGTLYLRLNGYSPIQYYDSEFKAIFKTGILDNVTLTILPSSTFPIKWANSPLVLEDNKLYEISVVENFEVNYALVSYNVYDLA